MARSEAAKQAIDQTLHAIWGLATGFIPFLAFWGLGWPGALAGCIVAAGSVAYWITREHGQWVDPDHPGAHVWWDPWLDSGVYATAVLGGALLGYFAF